VRINEVESSIVITAASLETALGNSPKLVIEALLKKKSAAVKNSAVTALSNDGFGYVPILNAPVKTLEFSRPFDRVMELCIRCLDGLFLKLPTNLSPSRLLLYIVLPAIENSRSQFLDSDEIKHGLLTVFSELYGCTLVFGREDQNFFEQIDNIFEELKHRKWDMVLLGGIDSLINSDTYHEMIQRNNIRKTGYLEAEMPGEGAAFVMLQRSGDFDLLSEAGVKIEKLDIEHIEQLGTFLKNVEMIISDRACDRKSDIAWYEETKHFWTESDNSAESIPLEIRSKRWLGNLGAAHIPMMLAVGVGWFELGSREVLSRVVVLKIPKIPPNPPFSKWGIGLTSMYMHTT